MKLLITGATGFVGKALIPFLQQKNIFKICLLVRNSEKARQMFPSDDYNLITSDKHTWRDEVISFNPLIVIHLAAFFTSKDDSDSANQLIESNITFSTLLLEAISRTSCQYFVNIGTFSEYLYGGGEYFPNNLYSATKSALRPILKYYQIQSKWKWINVIVYTPYGRKNAYKKVIDYLVDALDSPRPIKFSAGEQILDFIHVDDMADFFYTLLLKLDFIEGKYTQFHLGTGEGHSIRDVASVIEHLSGKQINAEWGGLPYRKYEIMHAVAPIAKNIELLNWYNKIGIEEGIKILLNE